MKQIELFKKDEKAHGGSLRNKRKGRGARPLAVKSSMHLVLRSSRATGAWSFHKFRGKIKEILDRFAKKYGVKIHSLAIQGNHLHIHIQLSNRYAYTPFIRAISAAIAMAVTGASRWKKVEGKFWDQRPFTRIVVGFAAFLALKDYVFINQIESQGYDRAHARLVAGEFARRSPG